MRNDNFLRIFLLLTLCTGYLVSFSHLGVFAYERFFSSGGSYADGTMIGNIPAAGVSNEALSQQLAADIEIWQETNSITVRYKEKAETLPEEIFSFNVEDSILKMESGQRNPISVQIDDELLNQFLRYFSSEEEVEKMNSTQFKEDLYKQAAFLNTNQREYRLEAYATASTTEPVVISQAVVSSDAIGSDELSTWMEKIKAIEIGPNEQISLLDVVEKAGLSNPSNELLSLVGSSIYQTIINSNFDILERHISRQLPKGIEPGFEARVVNKKQDLVFFNPNLIPYVLSFEAINNGVKTTLQGEPLFYRYEAIVKDIQTFEPKTIVQYNAAFPPNVRNIEEMGKEGMAVKVYRHAVGEEGPIETVLLAEDFYPPVHMIEQRGFKVEDEQENVVNHSSDSTEPVEAQAPASSVKTDEEGKTGASEEPVAADEKENTENQVSETATRKIDPLEKP